MAAPAQPTPQQMAQMQEQMKQQFLAEAAKRGMTPQQFQEFQQQQLEAEAKKAGMTREQFIQHIRTQQMKQHQQQQQGQTQPQGQVQGQPSGQQSQAISVNPNNPPKPEALSVAKFLRGQDLKTRTCILEGQRKDMFKGTVIRLSIFRLQSQSYPSQACATSASIASLYQSAFQEFPAP